MKKKIKSIIANQSRRKIKFITTPIETKNKTNYNYKVMTYAKYSEELKVKEKQILYQVRNGKSITGNPYAIFLYLVTSQKYEKYTHKWVVDSESTLKFYKNKFKNYKNVEFVIYESNAYLKALAQSKYLFNDSTFPSYFSKKKTQIYINTWHGTPLKYMGLDIDNNLKDSQNVIKNFLSSDYLISSNRHTTNIFKRAFNLENIYPGEILEIGYPRIDLTIASQSSKSREGLKDKLNLNNKKLLLYCPTWRGRDLNHPDVDLETLLSEVKQLERQLDYKVLLKVHPFIYNSAVKESSLIPYLVPDYCDTNELLTIVDLMVTDYSSIFFDYLVTNKPIVFYTSDYEDYKFDRGMYIDKKELPGPIVNSIEEVINSINCEHYNSELIRKNYQKFKDTYVNLEDGKVSQKLIEYIFDKKGIYPEVNKKNKQTLLFYPGGMKNNGITSSMINLLENIDYNQYDVTLFLNNTKNPEILNNIEQINSKVRIIFRNGPLLASVRELYLVNFVKQRGLSSIIEKKIYPRKVYEREFRKIFGNSHFDYVIDFSGYSMFWANLILASQSKRKFIYLHSDMKADMEKIVKGVKPHYQNLKGLISLYPYFDKLVSVSKATSNLNKEKINNGLLNSKFYSAKNTINLNKICHLAEDDSDRFEKMVNLS